MGRLDMIQEDYVSFELAKLLKEKGFDESVNRFYEISSGQPVFVRSEYCRNSYTTAYAAPTLQMTMKWLREKCKLCIEPYRTAYGYLYTISAIPYGTCIYNSTNGGDDEDSGQWTTYEKAVNAAIKYCLENIIL